MDSVQEQYILEQVYLFSVQKTYCYKHENYNLGDAIFKTTEKGEGVKHTQVPPKSRLSTMCMGDGAVCYCVHFLYVLLQCHT